MLELLLFLFGFVCGVMAVIFWAILKASSKESRREEPDIAKTE